jgi:hypothetical protein
MTSVRTEKTGQHIDPEKKIAEKLSTCNGLVHSDSDCHKLTRSDSSQCRAIARQPIGEPRCNVGDCAQSASADIRPTRTEDTVASYRARWPSLVRLAAGQCRLQTPTLEGVVAVAQWLAGAQGSYRPSTYRQYRAALLWTLEQMPTVEPSLRQRIKNCLKAEDVQEGKARSRLLDARTSAKKRKRIEEEDFATLRDVLGASPLASDCDLLVFLEANLMVGLRPSEWDCATLSLTAQGDVVLKVFNGKATNGRANGSFRTLTFSEHSDGQAYTKLRSCLKLVERVLEGVDPANRKAIWTRFCRALQDRFRTLNHDLWPRRTYHYTLYSSRHTLIAAAKQKYNSCEVAAIAGHGADATATRHYARPDRGKLGPRIVLPAPAEAEVASVRKTLNLHRLDSSLRSLEYRHNKPR